MLIYYIFVKFNFCEVCLFVRSNWFFWVSQNTTFLSWALSYCIFQSRLSLLHSRKTRCIFCTNRKKIHFVFPECSKLNSDDWLSIMMPSLKRWNLRAFKILRPIKSALGSQRFKSFLTLTPWLSLWPHSPPNFQTQGPAHPATSILSPLITGSWSLQGFPLISWRMHRAGVSWQLTTTFNSTKTVCFKTVVN